MPLPCSFKPCALAAALLLSLPLAGLAADEVKDFSPAEKALFMTDQFSSLTPPSTLKYVFRKSGSLEPGFSDQASLQLRPSRTEVAALSAVNS